MSHSTLTDEKLDPQLAEGSVRPVLAYVAGHGRSGTTLIDRVLGGHPDVLGCGEVSSLIRSLASGAEVKRCTCGAAPRECEVWAPVVAGLAASHARSGPAMQHWERTRSSVEAGPSLWRLLLPFGAARWRRAYNELTRLTLGAVAAGAAPSQRVIVDSSKTGWSTTWRPLALLRWGDMDVRAIHIVRDPRGTVWSVLKTAGFRRPAYRLRNVVVVVRTVLGWLASNTAASALRVLLPEGRYLRVGYEELAASPIPEFRTITSFLGIDPLRWDGDRAVRAGGHQCYGNSMRGREHVIIEEDVAWKEELPIGFRLGVKLVTFPWTFWYGRHRSTTLSRPTAPTSTGRRGSDPRRAVESDGDTNDPSLRPDGPRSQ
ncbi:MAG: sulfotransferase [Chloroflexi bacterium]|nr:sulfotransferase [Chloroflexota bacterium]